MIERTFLRNLVTALADDERELDLVVVAPLRPAQANLLAEADERGARLEEQAPVAYALLDVGAAVRDPGVLDRLGDVVVVVDRRGDDLARIGHRREQLHLRKRLALRPGRELLRRGEHAPQVQDERIARRDRPALRGDDFERPGDVEHFVVLHDAQTVLVEAADFHASRHRACRRYDYTQVGKPAG